MTRSLNKIVGALSIAVLVAMATLFASCAHGQQYADVSGPDTRTKLAVPAPPAGIKHVIIVSFDGGKPAVIDQAPMPVLKSMAESGAATWNAQTIMPSITLVAHTSMLTGVAPSKHKILWNEWKPERGPIATVPTAFALAKQGGLVTGCIAGKEKFKHFNVPGTLDDFEIPDYHAAACAAAAARFIAARKPGLLFVHFSDPDGAGHAFGWGSPQQIQALADSDEALGVLRDAVAKAGIAKSTVFIMSADHGGHDHTHGLRIPDDMTIPWITYGAGVRKHFSITQPVVTYDTAATALWLLGIKLPADFDGQPVASAYVTR
ncbi:MAG: alkaline phosphatase family protein [Capsulimonadaceae bacterium]|nr:alkaline phosphatase family protein [Capsulimonadaceae bacterium]